MPLNILAGDFRCLPAQGQMVQFKQIDGGLFTQGRSEVALTLRRQIWTIGVIPLHLFQGLRCLAEQGLNVGRLPFCLVPRIGINPPLIG